ncbi:MULTISPECIES: phage minor head protein [unclassified Sphingomonas]|uniref:phage minor head protein n=1 Tax=unclassified Sphingomonas TaxID=196159 RepID=UPI0008361D2B|nr:MULTISPECIES: phage minor head protein [unclassified Sphingomonas]
MDPTEVPVLPPIEAVRFFVAKGFRFGFSWKDVWQEEHAKAFTVAKAMSRDVLETIREAVLRAIEDGETLDEFRRELQPRLEQLGWWGRKRRVDPLTGENRVVQLGSPRRLKTIFQVNMRTAYQAGRWQRIVEQKKTYPYLRYTSVLDGREREEHGAWHGTLLPIDDPWWDTHYPPCGWNCRCTATAFNQRMMDRRGYSVTLNPVSFPKREWTNDRTGEVHQVEGGIDPGWSYNVGKASLAGLAPTPMPESFSGDDIASATAPRALGDWFRAFDITARDAQAGRNFIDAGGWPLAISLAWFQRDGQLVLPPVRRRALVGRAARAIVAPDEIRWAWVRGRDGRAMLFRRYLVLQDGRVATAVDVGRAGWRFMDAAEGAIDRLRVGTLDWSREDEALASKYQPREPKGSPKGGRFKSTGKSAFLTSLAEPGAQSPGLLALGDMSEATASRVAIAAGRPLRSPAVWLDWSNARHSLKRHGNDDYPVSTRMIGQVNRMLDRATSIVPGARPGYQGSPTIRAEHKQRKVTTVAVFEVRRRGLVLVTMYRKGSRPKRSGRVSPA